MIFYSESDCCYCTLFNSFYLDRAVTMLRSLIKNSGEIRIYVLAMDNPAFQILHKLALEKVVLIRHDDFATEELQAVKAQRTVAEYCWTCTAALIRYILDTYQEKVCTYIDADLFFYKNPYCLVEEMLDAGCSVQIVEHRFGKGIFAEHMRKYSGTFCVQFNTFKNDEKATELLDEWAAQCIECCSSVQNVNTFGDQKYLENWAERYNYVHILQNEGGGVAPWNVHQYHLKSIENGTIRLENKKSKKVEELVFYHFHGLQFLEKGKADINVYKRNFGIEKKLIEFLYRPYIQNVLTERRHLRKGMIQSELCEKQDTIIGKTQRAKRVITREDFLEKAYCKIRGIFLKTRKKDDILEYKIR